MRLACADRGWQRRFGAFLPGAALIALVLTVWPASALATPPNASFIFEPTAPAVNEPVTFSSTSSDPDGPLIAATMLWDLDGDGQFDDATGSTAESSFGQTGTFPVSLQVTDLGGETSVATRSVVVQPRSPTASFTLSPAAPQTQEPVVFDGGASAAPPGETIVAMSWDLDGDGSFDDGTGATAQYTYPTTGARIVGLRVEASGGGASVATRVVAPGNRLPSASFRATPRSPDAGDEVQLSSTSFDPDGPIVAQAWDLDGDRKYDDATGPNAHRSFREAGRFSVGLRVSDADGGTAVQRAVVVVSEPKLPLLTPFPIVRLAGSVSPSTGATRIKKLTAVAPKGARVTVRCQGKSCPFKQRSRRARKNRVRIGEIEGRLRAGTVLEVFVTEPGTTGKYTRFKLRAESAPKRTDRCVEGVSLRPARCPRP